MSYRSEELSTLSQKGGFHLPLNMVMKKLEMRNSSSGESPRPGTPLDAPSHPLIPKVAETTSNTSRNFLYNFAKKCWDGLFKALRLIGYKNTSTNTTNGSKSDLQNMKTITEPKYKPYFQWIRGEKAGQIVKSSGSTYIDDDNMEFMVFEDGTQCNTLLIGEWILPLDNPGEGFMLEEPKVQPQPPVVDMGLPYQERGIPEKVNPIHDLLEMSKKHDTSISVKIELKMPSEELMKVIQDSYENGSGLIGDYLISTNREAILEQIEEIIRERVIEATHKKTRR